MRITEGLSTTWINVDADRPRSSRIFAGRGSTVVSRARTFANASVHGEARWGRTWYGRCRMKSRSDTTPAHSIITKPRDPPAICPPSSLLLSLRIVGPCDAYTRGWRIQCHDEPTREFTIDPQPWVRPIPSLPSLYFSTSLPLSLCHIRSSFRRPCSPTWLRSIHRPSSGHIGGVLPAHRSGKCKMDVLRSRGSDFTGGSKPDSIPLRPVRGQRMSYNVTASSKEDKSISRLRRISLYVTRPFVSRIRDGLKWLRKHGKYRY